MSNFLRFPVVTPNGPGGTHISDDGQTHAMIRADWITAIVPVRPGAIMSKDNPHGCLIHMAYGGVVEVCMSAADVYDMLGEWDAFEVRRRG